LSWISSSKRLTVCGCTSLAFTPPNTGLT
jgi:hypothetical protein